MAALQVGVVEGEVLESKSIIPVSFWIRLTMRLTQGIDEIIRGRTSAGLGRFGGSHWF